MVQYWWSKPHTSSPQSHDWQQPLPRPSSVIACVAVCDFTEIPDCFLNAGENRQPGWWWTFEDYQLMIPMKPAVNMLNINVSSTFAVLVYIMWKDSVFPSHLFYIYFVYELSAKNWSRLTSRWWRPRGRSPIVGLREIIWPVRVKLSQTRENTLLHWWGCGDVFVRVWLLDARQLTSGAKKQ